jgi:hypothetical protein
MKMLACSADLENLEQVVKRLIHAHIPCAVSKGSSDSRLSVWVQRDADFSLALRVASKRQSRPRLPYWTAALDFCLSATRYSASPLAGLSRAA